MWDGTNWKVIISNTEGDVKQGFQNANHNGWILLDGRAISTLTATQQTVAISLGFTGNLPDATDAYLSQNGGSLGAVIGNNEVTLVQGNLPNYNMSANSSSDSHNHTYSRFNDAGTTRKGGNNQQNIAQRSANHATQTSSTDTHNHSVTINSGGSDTPIDITPKTLSVNTFVYLGN